jgi:hypothetical protein
MSDKDNDLDINVPNYRVEDVIQAAGRSSEVVESAPAWSPFSHP